MNFINIIICNKCAVVLSDLLLVLSLFIIYDNHYTIWLKFILKNRVNNRTTLAMTYLVTYCTFLHIYKGYILQYK